MPAGSCDPARLSATPAGSMDWFGCDLPGTRDLRSWTRYVLAPAAGCSVDPGTIVASGGASRLVSNSAYDHRFELTQVTHDIAGRLHAVPVRDDHVHDARARHRRADHEPGDQGRPGRADRHRRADGRSAPRAGMFCLLTPEQYADETVMNLELSTTGAIVPGPATVAEPSGRLGGGEYPAGQPWGTFTFLAPTR